MDNGFRKTTIDCYVERAGKYLEFAQTHKPSPDTLEKFRATLHARKLARQTINNYCIAIKSFHGMLGDKVSFPFLRISDTIPYYFSQDDVVRIFSVCRNLKHYTMLNVLFYACLRASELCSLNDEDVDLNALTIRIREGKGGKQGMVLISDPCAKVLRKYLAVRPALEIDGEQSLFFTDYGKRWDRGDLSRMFYHYKEMAGISKRGGVHVFGRHTPATIMIANGADLRIVQEVLRHRDIRTTLRYAHISDKTKRERYQQCLVL